jgi:hypothetical protein
MIPEALQKWHLFAETKNTDLLDEMLADDAKMHSPVVHTVQEGKAITKMYLTAASVALFNGTFKYVREVYDQSFALLEFEVELDGISVNGIDMISMGPDGKITDFKVMIRPLKGINAVHKCMGEALMQMKKPL